MPRPSFDFDKLKPQVGATLNPLHPLSKGLVGFWPFLMGTSEGSVATEGIDASGNDKKATITGGTWKRAQFNRYAVEAEATGDIISLPTGASTDNDHYLLDGQPFSVSWWEFPTTAPGTNISRFTLKIGDNTTSAYTNTFQTIVSSTGSMRWGAKDESSYMTPVTSTALGSRLNTWTHFVVTGHDPATTSITDYEFYENGSALSVTSVGASIGVPSFVNNFGDSSNYDDADCYYDLIMIYNRQIHADEALDLFNHPFQMFNNPIHPAIIQSMGLIKDSLQIPSYYNRLKGIYR